MNFFFFLCVHTLPTPWRFQCHWNSVQVATICGSTQDSSSLLSLSLSDTHTLCVCVCVYFQMKSLFLMSSILSVSDLHLLLVFFFLHFISFCSIFFQFHVSSHYYPAYYLLLVVVPPAVCCYFPFPSLLFSFSLASFLSSLLSFILSCCSSITLFLILFCLSLWLYIFLPFCSLYCTLKFCFPSRCFIDKI